MLELVDERLEGEIHVTVIATGFENGQPYRTERSVPRAATSAFSPAESQDSGARIPEFLRQRQQRQDGGQNN